MYRIKNGNLEVFLVHPGGPLWKNNVKSVWSIPKGEVEIGEDFFVTAKREFEEETGMSINLDVPFISLGNVTQRSGKIVHAWAFEGDWPGIFLKQNIIEIELPAGSGKKIQIPEIDHAEFFKIEEAKKRINMAQIEFIDRLQEILSNNSIKN